VSGSGGRRSRFAPLIAGTIITILLLLFVGRIADVLLLLFLAVLLSLYLGAIADFLTKHTRLSRHGALFLGVLGSLALLTGFFFLIVPPIIEQTQMLVRVLPEHLARWDRWLEQLPARIPALRNIFPPGQHQVMLAVYDQASGYLSALFPKLFGIVEAIISLFSVGIMALYLTLEPVFYRDWLLLLFPPRFRELVADVLKELGQKLLAYLVGQIAGMVFLGALSAILLWIIGVPYWLTFGVFTGAAAIVPFFGSLTSTVLPALFVLGDGGLSKVLLVIIAGIVVHLIEGNLVSPLIFERQVKLPPVLTVMSVLIMGKLLGPIGLVVAVPTLLIVTTLVRRILIERIYLGRGFRVAVRPPGSEVRATPPGGDILDGQTTSSDPVAPAEAEHRQSVA